MWKKITGGGRRRKVHELLSSSVGAKTHRLHIYITYVHIYVIYMYVYICNIYVIYIHILLKVIIYKIYYKYVHIFFFRLLHAYLANFPAAMGLHFTYTLSAIRQTFNEHLLGTTRYWEKKRVWRTWSLSLSNLGPACDREWNEPITELR